MGRGLARLLAALMCALLLGACGAESSPDDSAGGSEDTEDTGGDGGAGLSGDPVLIGIGVAETSNVALLGQEEVIGAKIAERVLNQRGGINGRPIKLIFEDTAGDEAGAINSFRSLIGRDVVGIVGPTLSQQAFAADPEADKAGVPVLGPSNTAKGIPQIGDYVARVSAPVAVVAPLAVEQALTVDPSIKTVAVAYAQNDAFSTSETGTFQETVKAKGLNLATVQQFQTSDTDFTAQANSMLGKKPQLIIISGLAADGGNLVRQLRELGYKGLIVGGNGLNTTNIFPVCGKHCDGVLIAQAYSPKIDNEVAKAFLDAYVKEQKKPPPQFSAQTFTAVQVFAEALARLDKARKLDSMDLKTLRTELNKAVLSGTYQTPLGPISFDPEGEIKQEQFYVAQIKMEADGQTGEFTFVR
ncbi:MAG TPA: ABC transporter substrate-binding protein [Acidimicrobiia bacterium]|nr:ABC transporter substrate-binding protein [Acidimicrobiia bacterium]